MLRRVCQFLGQTSSALRDLKTLSTAELSLNRPGFAGDRIVRITRPYRVWSGLHETRLLCFCGRDVADGFKQGEGVNATGSSEPTNVVEPIDPFEGFQFHLLHSFPRAAPANDLGFVKANDRFGQGPRQWS